MSNEILNEELRHHVACNNVKEVHKLLNNPDIQLQPDIEACDKNGNTPLILAASLGCIDVLEYLISQGANIDALGKNNESALIKAIKCKELSAVKCLIKHNANIKILDKNNWTILHHAVETQSIPILKYLLTLNLNINAKSKLGKTTLHVAADTEDNQTALQIVDLLIEHGANPNETDKDGVSVLMYAVFSDNLNAVKLLLDHNADLNLSDSDGDTPLFGAIYRANTQMATFLIEEGADITVKNKKKQTPFECAIANDCSEIIRYFVENKLIHYTPNSNKKYSNTIELTAEEIIKLPQTNPELLQHLIITGELLAILKKNPYEKQVEIYKTAKNRLNQNNKNDFENVIRESRQYREKE